MKCRDYKTLQFGILQISSCHEIQFLTRNSIFGSDLSNSGVQKGKVRKFEFRKSNVLIAYCPVCFYWNRSKTLCPVSIQWPVSPTNWLECWLKTTSKNMPESFKRPSWSFSRVSGSRESCYHAPPTVIRKAIGSIYQLVLGVYAIWYDFCFFHGFLNILNSYYRFSCYRERGCIHFFEFSGAAIFGSNVGVSLRCIFEGWKIHVYFFWGVWGVLGCILRVFWRVFGGVFEVLL